MLTLYDYYRSTACYRVRIALFLKHIPFKTITCDLIKDGGRQYTDNFQRMNAQQLIPVLVDPAQDLVLSQSTAIIEYLNEIYPTPNLLPQTSRLRAQARRITNIIACEMHPLNNLRVLQYLKHTLHQSEADKLDWYHHWLKLGFDALEKIVSTTSTQSSFCINNDISIADIYLIPQLYNAKRFNFPLEDYPKLLDIEAHCLKHPAFIQASPENTLKRTSADPTSS